MARTTKTTNGRKSARSASPSRTRRRPTTRRQKPALNSPSAAPETGSEPTRSWTFLTNHAHVLIVLDSEPAMVLREVAQRVGITERAVQRIVHELEEQGFLRREKVGRQNRYEVVTDNALRHPLESHRTIGDLIDLIHG